MELSPRSKAQLGLSVEPEPDGAPLLGHEALKPSGPTRHLILPNSPSHRWACAAAWWP